MSRRRRSKQRAARERKRRERAKVPSYEHRIESSRVDVQVGGGPYGTYLHQLGEVVGERAWAALRDLEREAWVADLLLAAHAVPFRDSVPYAAFLAARAAGGAGVDMDETTRLNINALVWGTILKPVARGATRSSLGGAKDHRIHRDD